MSDATQAWPPAPTEDLDQAERDLKGHGVAVVHGMLDTDRLKEVRDTVYRLADQDVRRRQVGEPIYSDKGVQRIWNLPSRDPIFCDLAEHPAALRLVTSVLGWPVQLSNISCNITGPGSGEMILHADQQMHPTPWARAHVVNIIWCPDDFTEASGATRMVPGTQRSTAPPAPDDPIETVPLVAKAGAMIAVDGRVWHKTGINRTKEERRAGIFAVYQLPIFLPQENWWLSLDPAVRQFGSDTLLTLMGFKGDNAFGRVNGLPVG